jgi:predicted enzyme related to lactoylglutathione lyase
MTTVEGRDAGANARLAQADTATSAIAADQIEGVPMNFNSLLIGASDVDALVGYYTKLFGKPMFEDSGYSGWQIGQGFITVGPHSEVSGQNPQPGRLMWNIETPDVRGEFARLQAAGAIVVREPYEFEESPGSAIATLADPEGNYFQLMSPMDMGSSSGS